MTSQAEERYRSSCEALDFNPKAYSRETELQDASENDMNWDHLIRIALPIGTFCLGVLSTWLFKRVEDRKLLVRRHAEEVTRLANEWYNQLHEIKYFQTASEQKRELQRKIDAYIDNRLILPQVLLSLGVLKGFPEASTLVYEVEGFLRIVTTYQVGENRLTCPFTRQLTKQGSRMDELLTELDCRLQKISQLAAALLTGRSMGPEMMGSREMLLLGAGKSKFSQPAVAHEFKMNRNA